MVAKYHRSRCNATCAALAVKPAPVSALAPTRFRAGAEHRGGWEARPEIAAPPGPPGSGAWRRHGGAPANRPLPAIPPARRRLLGA